MRWAIHCRINMKLAAETSDPLACTATTVFLGNLEMKRSGSIALGLHTHTGTLNLKGTACLVDGG